MSEQELREKSDQELAKLCAIALGVVYDENAYYEWNRGLNRPLTYPCISDDDGTPWILNSEQSAQWYKPWEDANQAIQLAEKVRSSVSLSLWDVDSPRPTKFNAGFYIENKDGLYVERYVLDPSFAKALTLASLLAFHSLEGEKWKASRRGGG